MKTKTRTILKRTVSVLLACVMIFGSAPIGALLGLDFSGLFEIKASAATYSGTCGTNLTWTLDTSTWKLVISGTGAMTDWSSSSDVPWYSYRSNIKTVIIENGVTSIGKYAFYCCESLTSITIPDSVTSIGSHAFYSCDSLTSVTIGNSVISIGDFAFYACYSLTDVYYTGDLAGWCGISFGILSANPMYYADNLYIGDKLLSWDIVIPDSVKSIGDYAFSGCTRITSVTIPDSVTSIGSSAFSGCSSLTDVYYTGDLAGWCGISFGNYYANPMEYANNLYIDGKILTGDILIPEGVTNIGNYAFYNCDSLTSATIPDSVTSIGASAFDCCDSLKTVYYTDTPSQWNKISIEKDNSPLTSAKIIYECNSDRPYYLLGSCGDNLSYVLYTDGELVISGTGDMTNWSYYSSAPWYSYRSYIKTVNIADTVTSIGEYAFYNSTSLTSVTIPDSVTSIGSSAFSGCDSLKDVYYTGDLAGWCSIRFNGYYANPMDYADNLYIDGKLLSGDIVIPEGVTSIGNYVFYGCTGLESVTIPDSVTSIGDSAFDYCDSLESITIPDSVTSIGDSAFYNCDSLESITIPDSVTSIGSHAFSYCSSLTSVTIPDSVTSIGDSAFDSCDSLTSITVDSGNAYYSSDEYGVLYNKNKTWLLVFCPNSEIKNFTVPDTVSVIGEDAFYNCDKLTSIDLNNVKTIKNWALAHCDTSTMTLYIPETITSIDEYAFYYSKFTVTYDCGNVYMKNYVSSSGYGSPKFSPIHNYVNNGGISSVCSKCNTMKTYDYVITTDETISLSFEANYSFTWDVSDSSVAYVSGTSSSVMHSGSIIKMKSTATFVPEKPGEFEARVINSSGKITAYVDVLVKEGKHQFVKESTVIEPTCSDIGKDLYKCKFCGQTKERDVAKLGHNIIHHKARAKTCSEIGWNEYDTCSRCSYSTYLEIPASHEWASNYSIDIKSKCEETGLKSIHCSECGNIKEGSQVIIPATGHTYKGKVTKAPTCTDTGIKTFSCHCGDSYTEVIKATGHTKGEWEYIGGNEYAKLCVGCDEKLESKIVAINMMIDGRDINKKQLLNTATSTVTATVTDNFVNNFVFSSSDSSIVSVDANGNVTANDVGKATITVTINGTAISDSIEIVVLPRDFTITWIVNGTETVQTVKEYEEIIPEVNTNVEGYMFKGWNAKVPETMPSENLTFTALLELIVPVSVRIVKAPAKTEYNYKQDKIDISGIELEVTYSDGTKDIIKDTSAMTVSGFSNEKTGEQTVTVEYEGLKAEYKVTVKYTWWQWILVILLFGWIWY